MGSRSRTPLVVAVLVMVVWGATPVVTRLGTHDMPPLLVGVMRTLLAGLIALPIIAVRREAPPRAQRGRALLLVSSLSGFVAFPVLYTIGQERTSAMHGAMILAGLPVITGVYAALLDRRRPAGRWFLGCALALAGEAAIVVLRAGSGGTQATLLGDLIVVASALLVSSGYIAGARLAVSGYPSISTTFWGVVIGSMIVGPIVPIAIADGEHLGGSPQAWLAILWLALVTSIIGYIGWYWALAHGGITRIAPMQFLQPFSGLVLAAVVLGERFTLPLILAAATILIGVSIAQRR